MKWLVLAILGAILAFAISLFVRLGAFKEVQIEIAQEGQMILLYKEHIGAYHKVVPVIEEVEAWARAHQVDCRRSFGEYLDNPEVVEESRLRARVGCLVDKIPQNLPAEFQIETKAPGSYIKARFDGSPSIGPFKVYGPVKRLAEEQRLKLLPWTIEIYEIEQLGVAAGGMHTIYLFPFDK